MTYRSALRAVGAEDEGWVQKLDQFLSGLIFVAAPLTGGASLSLIDPKSDAINLINSRVLEISKKKSWNNYADRQRALEAAYAILVHAACVNAIAHKLDIERWRGSKRERSADAEPLNNVVLATEIPLPDSARSADEHKSEILQCYRAFASHAFAHLKNLAPWDELDETEQSRLSARQLEVPGDAWINFTDLLRQFRVDVPEFGVWYSDKNTERQSHQLSSIETDVARNRAATDALARPLGEVHIGLNRVLEHLARPTPSSGIVAALAAVHRSSATELLIDDAQLWLDLDQPITLTKEDSYVEPMYRVARSQRGSEISEESWWRTFPIDRHLGDLLLHAFSTTECIERPLLVVGHPGCGKSLFTQILASRLADTTSFCPVVVPLRLVDSSATLDEQIAEAVKLATNTYLTWREFRLACGTSTPVLIFDGLDELLMTTGDTHQDFPARVARFQKAESNQGQPCLAVITSRMNLMARAQVAPDALTVLLEPFDPAQVRTWLTKWNRALDRATGGHPSREVTAEDLAWASDLTPQPILLFMLALEASQQVSSETWHYEAMTPFLRSPTHHHRVAVYERLLVSFMLREIDRDLGRHGQRELRRKKLDEEMFRLEVTALSMFNRGSQYVHAPDLENDFASVGLDRRIGDFSSADEHVGRFFFVITSRATSRHRGSPPRLSTVEFLHLTFQEYLVARAFVRSILAESDGGTADGLPSAHELFGYELLADYQNIRSFVSDLWSTLDRGGSDVTTTLRRLSDHGVHRSRTGGSYNPVPRSFPEWSATLTANVCLVHLQVQGSIDLSALSIPAWVGEGAGHTTGTTMWERTLSYWQAGLSDQSFDSLIDAIWVSSKSGNHSLSLVERRAQPKVAQADRLGPGEAGPVLFTEPGRGENGTSRFVSEDADYIERSIRVERLAILGSGNSNLRTAIVQRIELERYLLATETVDASTDRGPSNFEVLESVRVHLFRGGDVDEEHLLHLVSMIPTLEHQPADVADHTLRSIAEVLEIMGSDTPPAVVGRLLSVADQMAGPDSRTEVGYFRDSLQTLLFRTLPGIAASAGKDEDSSFHQRAVARLIRAIQRLGKLTAIRYYELFVALRRLGFSHEQVGDWLGDAHHGAALSAALTEHWSARRLDDVLTFIRLADLGSTHLRACHQIISRVTVQTLMSISRNNLLYFWHINREHSDPPITGIVPSLEDRWARRHGALIETLGLYTFFGSSSPGSSIRRAWIELAAAHAAPHAALTEKP